MTRRYKKNRRARSTGDPNRCGQCGEIKTDEYMARRYLCVVCSRKNTEARARGLRRHLILLPCGIVVTGLQVEAWWNLYKVTKEQWSDQWLWQGGKCPVSGYEFRQDSLPHIDHNHASGKFRGLLARDPNLALGLLRDKPQQCLNAAVYLASDGIQAPNRS